MITLVLLAVISLLIYLIIFLAIQVTELKGRVENYRRFLELQDYIEYFNLQKEDDKNRKIKNNNLEVDRDTLYQISLALTQSINLYRGLVKEELSKSVNERRGLYTYLTELERMEEAELIVEKTRNSIKEEEADK
ncbi:hypothetical protein [Bacillus coahuilensis]|uniref:hypothetical protein n=1 Tax=Bacillus coahuilensis TaxID=408580 RepID=UPI0001851304|nr:hypothetical protein [Bacillus coahuilensis]